MQTSVLFLLKVVVLFVLNHEATVGIKYVGAMENFDQGKHRKDHFWLLAWQISKTLH